MISRDGSWLEKMEAARMAALTWTPSRRPVAIRRPVARPLLGNRALICGPGFVLLGARRRRLQPKLGATKAIFEKSSMREQSVCIVPVNVLGDFLHQIHRAALLEIDGSVAVAIATPKTPMGNCISLKA